MQLQPLSAPLEAHEDYRAGYAEGIAQTITITPPRFRCFYAGDAEGGDQIEDNDK